MGRNQATPSENPRSRTKPVPSKSTKATSKSKASETVNTSTGREQHDTPANTEGNNTVSILKRQRDSVDKPVPGRDGEAAESKRPKTAPKPAPDRSTRRSGRVQTKASGVPVAPKRKRRTKEEIAADKARAEAELRRKEELTQEQQQMMDKMDVDEDRDRAETVAKTIKTFAQLEEASESSAEEFNGYDDVLGSDSESADDNGVGVMNKPKTQNAARNSKSKNGGGEKKSGGGKNKQVTFASGLRQDWESKSNVKTLPKKRTQVQISVGGLDSDLEDVNPYLTSDATRFPSHPPTENTNAHPDYEDTHIKHDRDHSRQNEMVTFAYPDDGEYVPGPRATAKKVKGTAKVLHSDSHHPTRSKSEKLNVNTIQPKAAKQKVRRLNGNNVRMSDLPDFARAKWRSAFLPTLYDKLFTSDEPFDKFAVGSTEFIVTLQSIVDEVYPDVDYEVSSSDSIHFLSHNRINEKRSSIGANTIKILEAHVKKLNESDRKAWLRWALRGDGPLFFKTPSPMNSPTNHKDPHYQFPEGRLLSPFIIDIASPLLTLKAGSVSSNGYPKGLIALILAALERAARYLSKPTVLPQEFSKEHYGSKVKTYCTGFRGVPDERWEDFIDLCKDSAPESDSGEDTLKADLSVLDHDRPFIFDFNSPAKSRK